MAYLPLSTSNLPNPVIDPAQGASPEDYFNTVLWTGDGTSSRSITGVGFQPDFLWYKTRNQTYDHKLFDVIRTPSNRLSSNSTGAEVSFGELSSFDSDGFTLVDGSASKGNGSGESMVAWNWKANGSGVTNTDGSITSTVSANTTSGFSIVSYTGTGSNATVGHGLDSALDMLIVKNRDRIANWHTWHNALTGAQFLELSSTAAAGTDAPSWNSTVPTSTVFSVGTSNATNASGEDLIAYCFHSVEGFSKFGSYVGNGSADGPFVYTGFRPAWVLIMCSSASANHPLADNARDTYNPAGTSLFPETADSDNSKTGREIDFLSNGFKIRNGNGEKNTSSATYIYMAFAEQPIKFSNAR